MVIEARRPLLSKGERRLRLGLVHGVRIRDGFGEANAATVPKQNKITIRKRSHRTDCSTIHIIHLSVLRLMQSERMPITDHQPRLEI